MIEYSDYELLDDVIVDIDNRNSDGEILVPKKEYRLTGYQQVLSDKPLTDSR